MPDLQSLAADLRAGKTSSREQVEESLRLIQQLNPRLNAFITITEEIARERAAQMDADLARGIDRGPLHGIPIAHKDLVRTKGICTTAGSKIFANYVPKRDAVIAEKLDHAGAVCVGKTGLHELAYGITSNNPHFGAIRNPWDPERIPGGSSGGSAVAVATGMVPFAVGTDTGGSIRVPASFCGIVGLKPTFGRISKKGVIPLGFSQDHIGPLTRTVRDCAVAFQAMVTNASGYVPPPDVQIKDLRIGLPKSYFFDRVENEVLQSVRRAAELAESVGAIVVEIDIPDMEAVRQAGATCLLVEAAAQLKPWAHRRGDFGSDIVGYLDQGNKITGVDYLGALRVRKHMSREFARLFDADQAHRVDVILTPSTAVTAPLIGQTSVEINGVQEETRFAATRFTRPFNAMGTPAISIPCGFSASGLPIGLQLAGAAYAEDNVLRVAAAMEDALSLPIRLPN
jgi:aspartyl-tRNA(Asn)/glutamyl-tRNA(Gln) amidotransferase subunit A